MICDECQKRATKVHITRIHNGQKTKLSLCEECAKKYEKHFSLGPNPEQAFSIQKFFAGLLDDDFEGGFSLQPQVEMSCEKCGLGYKDFLLHGRLGCSDCYGTFRNRIDPLLEKIHGNNLHLGKVPGNLVDVNDKPENQELKELDSLRSELQVLIAEERFEEAVTVRDRIREIEAKIEDTS